MKVLYVWIACFVLIPINWIQSIKYLSYVSMIANVAIVSALICIFVYDFEEMNDPEGDHEVRLINIPGFPYYFGVAVFIFEGKDA